MAMALLTILVVLSDSPIKDDEVVVFFPGVARPAPGTSDGSWELSFHGWIHEPEFDSLRRRALLSTVRSSLGLERDDPETETFLRRARWFLVDDERAKEVSILLGDGIHVLPGSEPNGHFRGTLKVSRDDFARLRGRPENRDGRVHFRAITKKGDDRVFAGELVVVEGPGLSVVSDIDDTLKVSEVRDRRALLANTFLREYRAVSGMADVYHSLEQRGARFHYVSASPWQLYDPLSSFLREAGFPGGTFHLKDFRVKDSTFFSLFLSPREYKISVLEPLIRGFPDRRFILVGDSGEQDPEVYGEIARALPDRIERILIRQVPGAEADEARLGTAFRDLPAKKWRTFRDPAELRAWVEFE